MERNENIAQFRNMLLDCYGMWSWHVDADLNVIDTNCTVPLIYDQLLLTDDRVRTIKEHAKDSGMPLVIGSVLAMVWSVVFVSGNPEADSRDEMLIMGPVFTGEVSKGMIERLVKPLELIVSQKWELIESLSKVPMVPLVTLSQHTVMLHYYACGKAIRVSDFVYYTPGTIDTEKIVRNNEDISKQHAPLINEKMLLGMVQTGNLNYHDALSYAGAVSPGIRTRSSDPIRQAKYSVVAFTALCTRAAIEGGLSSDSAYSLCDLYTESVDNCKTISEIAAVSHTMYDDFIRRVNRCRNTNGVSRPVQACCDYIDTHPSDELSVDYLAERAGYTAYYFSRMFKKETGKTVKEYILRVRLQQAKTLLTTTNMSIQEISELLHFCSQSYFAGQFQKIEGITPAEYRVQNRNR